MDTAEFCKNCRHYKQHYYWYDGRLNKASSGHCLEHKRSRLVFHNDSCEKWEISEFKRTPPDSTFETVLRKMAKTVEDIANILKSDN